MNWQLVWSRVRSVFQSEKSVPPTAKRKSARRLARRRPWVEALEDRNLLSGMVAPVAFPHFTDTDGTTPVTVNLLADDWAPGGSQNIVAGSVQVTGGPAHGQVTLQPSSGPATYTAVPGFGGTDTFTYTFRDKQGDVSNSGVVVVRVNRPTATDDWTDTDGTTPVAINVLANDTDPDGNQHLVPSSVSVVGAPLHGRAVVDPSTGQITYTANSTFTGTDSFQYTVIDDNGATSNAATVYVRVNRPTAGDDLASFSGTTPVAIDVLANDTDPDGNQHLVPSSVVVVTDPQHGSYSVNPKTGAITYTANAGFNGTDTLQYTVMDDNGAISMPATVTVVGFQPGTINGSFTDTDGTTPVIINVLANDFVNSPGGSPSGNVTLVPASVTVTTQPADGHAVVNPTTGAITYNSTVPGFLGTDTLQYTVQDTNGNTYGPVTVSVRVNRPTAADDWTDTDGTTSVIVAVLANDTDPDGNQHLVPSSVTVVTAPQHGQFKVDSTTGAIKYTANANFMGTDSFQYTVMDDNGATSNVATVYVRVNRPTATDDYAAATGTTPVTVNVLANDSDPDGNQHLVPSTVTVVTAPQHARYSVNPKTGAITYTANAGWIGVDTFQYTVTDDNGGTSLPATVTVVTSAPGGRSGSTTLVSSSRPMVSWKVS